MATECGQDRGATGVDGQEFAIAQVGQGRMQRGIPVAVENEVSIRTPAYFVLSARGTTTCLSGQKKSGARPRMCDSPRSTKPPQQISQKKKGPTFNSPIYCRARGRGDLRGFRAVEGV